MDLTNRKCGTKNRNNPQNRNSPVPCSSRPFFFCCNNGILTTITANSISSLLTFCNSFPLSLLPTNMYTFLLWCFLYNFFSTTKFFDIANFFKHPHEYANDLESVETSSAIDIYASIRLEGKIEKMTDTKILILDWFVYQHFVLKGKLDSAALIYSVTELMCIKNPSTAASMGFFQIMLDYVKTIIFRNAGGSKAAVPVIRDQSSVHNAGGSNAAVPFFRRGQSSVGNAGGSNASGHVVIRDQSSVPNSGGSNAAEPVMYDESSGLLDAVVAQSYNISRKRKPTD